MMKDVDLVQITPNAIDVLKKVAGVCYGNKVSDKGLQHIINAGHLSVLEHCNATFSFTCSISTLLQLTRHRHFSFTVQSTRGSILKSFEQTGIEWIDKYNRDTFSIYELLYYEGLFSPEDLSHMLPKSAEYEVYMTGNFRAWLEYLPKRLCKRASKAHRELAQAILIKLKGVYPLVFDEVHLNCKECKERSCSFA